MTANYRSNTKLPIEKLTLAAFERYLKRGQKERHTVYALVTPDMAKDILRITIGGESERKVRDMSEAHILVLRKKMQDNRWMLIDNGVCFNWFSRLDDANHRLHALSGADVDCIPLTLTFGCDPKEREVHNQGLVEQVSKILKIIYKRDHDVSLSAAYRLHMLASGYTLETRDRERVAMDTNEQMPASIMNAAFDATRWKKPLQRGLAMAFWRIANSCGRYGLAEEVESVSDFYRRCSLFPNKGELSSHGAVYRRVEWIVNHFEGRSASDIEQLDAAATAINGWNLFRQNRKRCNVEWDRSSPFPNVEA